MTAATTRPSPGSRRKVPAWPTSSRQPGRPVVINDRPLLDTLGSRRRSTSRRSWASAGILLRVPAFVGLLGVMEFAAWYSGFRPRLVGALTLLSSDTDAAVDAADEALVRALERWDRVGQMVSPEGWAYRVGVNLLRRGSARRRLERLLWARGQPAAAAAPELGVEVWEAVKALSGRQRQAVALRYVLGLTEAGTAAAMGVAVGTASATLAAARARLAVRLAEDDTMEVRG